MAIRWIRLWTHWGWCWNEQPCKNCVSAKQLVRGRQVGYEGSAADQELQGDQLCSLCLSLSYNSPLQATESPASEVEELKGRRIDCPYLPEFRDKQGMMTN